MVDELTFCVSRGETLGLLGGNGAGKTTTIAMLLGLLIPTAGSIFVLGHDMARERFAALGRMNFSSPYVALPARLSVAENLRIYGHLYGVAKLERRITELAAELELTDLLHRPAGALSAGQKTRVALAKALVNRPEVLLLDEPTASLDPDTGDWVRSWLERYRAGSGCTVLLLDEPTASLDPDTGDWVRSWLERYRATSRCSILLASHNMAEVERLCSTVLMLKRGRVVDRGTPDALLAKYARDDLEDVFLDIARNRVQAGGRAA